MKKPMAMIIGALLCASSYSADTVYVSPTSSNDGPGTAWSNAANSASGTFSAPGEPAYSWQVSDIPLNYGGNTIWVLGRMLWDRPSAIRS